MSQVGELLTIAQAARHFGVSATVTLRWVKTGLVTATPTPDGTLQISRTTIAQTRQALGFPD